jgi:hypothetical protein
MDVGVVTLQSVRTIILVVGGRFLPAAGESFLKSCWFAISLGVLFDIDGVHFAFGLFISPHIHFLGVFPQSDSRLFLNGSGFI